MRDALRPYWMPSLNHSLPTTSGQHNTLHQATDRVKSLSNRESQKTLQSYHLSDISLHQFQYFVHLHYPLFRQFLSLVQIFNPILVPLLTSAPACKLLISFSPLVSKLYQNIALPDPWFDLQPRNLHPIFLAFKYVVAEVTGRGSAYAGKDGGSAGTVDL